MNEKSYTGDKSYVTTLLLAFFFGPFGAHRFYTGYIGIGVAQLVLSLLTGLGIIWALVDNVAIALNKYKDSDGNDLADANLGCGLIVLIFLGLTLLMLIVAFIYSAIAVFTPHY